MLCVFKLKIRYFFVHYFNKKKMYQITYLTLTLLISSALATGGNFYLSHNGNNSYFIHYLKVNKGHFSKNPLN